MKLEDVDQETLKWFCHNNYINKMQLWTVLEKRGRNWVGRCPICQQTQFNVNEEKEFFHCFSCGSGGKTFGDILKQFYRYQHKMRLSYRMFSPMRRSFNRAQLMFNHMKLAVKKRGITALWVPLKVETQNAER